MKALRFTFCILALTLVKTAPLYSQDKTSRRSNPQTPTNINFDNYNNQTSCPNFDLSSQFPLPSRDQGSMGWCFGFVAADIISAKIGQQVSAADVSMNYFYGNRDHMSIQALERARLERQAFLQSARRYDSPPISFASGRRQGPLENITSLSNGHTRFALDFTQNRGACLESDFPSQDYVMTEHVVELQNFVEQIQTASQQANNIQESFINDVTHALPNLNRTDVTTAISETQIDALSSLIDRSCTQRLPFQFRHLNSQSFMVNNETAYMNNGSRMHEILTKNFSAGHPISIGYNPDVLRKPNPNSKSSSQPHASILLGQRLNPLTNKCEVLLRNSWGTDCSYAHESYECLDNGHIWLSRDALLLRTFEITEAY